MLLTALVIQQNPFLNRILNHLICDLETRFFAGTSAGQCGGDLQDVVSTTGIATGIGSDFLQHFFGCGQLHRP